MPGKGSFVVVFCYGSPTMGMCHRQKGKVGMERVDAWKRKEKNNVVETLWLNFPTHLCLSVSLVSVNNLGIETKIFWDKGVRGIAGKQTPLYFRNVYRKAAVRCEDTNPVSSRGTGKSLKLCQSWFGRARLRKPQKEAKSHCLLFCCEWLALVGSFNQLCF